MIQKDTQKLKYISEASLVELYIYFKIFLVPKMIQSVVGCRGDHYNVLNKKVVVELVRFHLKYVIGFMETDPNHTLEVTRQSILKISIHYNQPRIVRT